MLSKKADNAGESKAFHSRCRGRVILGHTDGNSGLRTLRMHNCNIVLSKIEDVFLLKSDLAPQILAELFVCERSNRSVYLA